MTCVHCKQHYAHMSKVWSHLLGTWRKELANLPKAQRLHRNRLLRAIAEAKKFLAAGVPKVCPYAKVKGRA